MRFRATPTSCSRRCAETSSPASTTCSAFSGSPERVPRLLPGLAPYQAPEGAEVQVEVLGGQVEAPPQLSHGLLEAHEPGAQVLDLSRRQVPLLDSAESLRLHQLPDEL